MPRRLGIGRLRRPRGPVSVGRLPRHPLHDDAFKLAIQWTACLARRFADRCHQGRRQAQGQALARFGTDFWTTRMFHSTATSLVRCMEVIIHLTNTDVNFILTHKRLGALQLIHYAHLCIGALSKGGLVGERDSSGYEKALSLQLRASRVTVMYHSDKFKGC
jgi:hypothetical protein